MRIPGNLWLQNSLATLCSACALRAGLLVAVSCRLLWRDITSTLFTSMTRYAHKAAYLKLAYLSAIARLLRSGYVETRVHAAHVLY